MLLRGVNTWDSCVGDLELFTHGDLELFTELFMRITDACSTHRGICLRCVSSMLFDKISGSKALNGFLGAADGQSQTYFGNNEFWHPEVSCKDLVSAEKLGRGKTDMVLCLSDEITWRAGVLYKWSTEWAQLSPWSFSAFTTHRSEPAVLLYVGGSCVQ